MSNEYRNNHYVPVWYQKRFMLPNQKNKNLFYLDLNPSVFTGSNGFSYKSKEIKLQGPKHCFVEKDLYTTQFEGVDSIEIERIFFGKIDSDGHKAVDYYANFSYPWDGGDNFKEMMMYMSTQKLRTIKGLKWLSKQINIEDKNKVLRGMLRLQQLYCATWTECVWLIADASRSDTKFIISDHPVTVYNRACGPQWCKRNGDPNVWLNGTHTIFPLSIDKILILTNLSWVRNPYQKETSERPNSNPLRNAIMKITDIQTLRFLDEDEVRQINFIIKNSAKRYLAAAKKEWLYPEKFVSKSDWYNYGNGYLFMPDPRPVHLGGTIMWGGGPGGSGAMDEYGRNPWDSEFEKENKAGNEGETLYRFKGEFARIFGPYRRGRSCSAITEIDNEKDDDKFYKYHLSLEKKHKKSRRSKNSHSD